ncbi:hypothetical protein C0992_008200 [Termitomyces sp. T32_za158]|nr:hypothetical protein C0992_008200 [Termitomyces sp. T32_za158]
MSLSPPIRRLSTTSSSSKEDLINAYEAEEERIINVLSRKLEQLREEKIDLENALEAESESHVNRLARELTALRQTQIGNATDGSVSTSPETGIGFRSFMNGGSAGDPDIETLLEALRRENEQLRNKLVDTERDYIRISRLNEVYREELIEHRRRLGMSVDNLIGLASADPYSQPTHRRSSSSFTNGSSLATSVLHVPTQPGARPIHAVPIPRPSSRIHRPVNLTSEGNTPFSHSPGSFSESPFPFSPATNSGSLTSPNTNTTSPPSSLSYNSNVGDVTASFQPRTLTYPSVPPPSLSSSFGSPTVPFNISHGEYSPIESSSRRSSGIARDTDWRLSESGSRRNSVERGARVAETGTLVPRSRTSSIALTSQAPAVINGTTDSQYSEEDLAHPTTPLAFRTWETIQNEQAQSQAQAQQQQQQHLQQLEQHSHSPDQPAPPSPLTPQQDSTRQSEDPPSRVGLSQRLSAYDDTPICLHRVPQRDDHEVRRESLRQQGHRPHLETQTSVAPTSTVGPTRQTRSSHIIQQQQVHPYGRRPRSALSSAPPSRQQPMVRFPSVQPSAQASSSGMHSPVVPLTAMPSPVIPSPASTVNRLGGYGSAIGDRSDREPRRKWMLRSDSWYDPEAKKLRVMLEVPGISKADVRVTLSTCSWNRVKQITVSGVSRPVFPPLSVAESTDGMMLELTTTRERRFGEFARTFAVPAETNRKDVEASIENGILYINIPCGTPVAPNAEDVPIR